MDPNHEHLSRSRPSESSCYSLSANMADDAATTPNATVHETTNIDDVEEEESKVCMLSHR